jgi:hypothetical protein
MTGSITRLRGAAALRDRARGFRTFVELHALRGNLDAVRDACEDLAVVEHELDRLAAPVVDIAIARRWRP